METAPTPNTVVSRAALTAAGLDVLAIVIFATIGRKSHVEGITPAGIAETSWPFLAGTAVGWLAARAWRRPTAVVPTGLIIWISTVVVGMALRIVSHQSDELKPSFLAVASISTAVLLLAWRGLAAVRRGSAEVARA